MLLQIHKFLQQEDVASNQRIAREFQIDPQALQPMLDIWLQKGVIVHYDVNTNCKSRCFKCKNPPLSYYRIVKNATL